MSKAKHPGLVGMHFMCFEDECTAKGRVLAWVGVDHYLVEMLNWGDGSVSHTVVVNVDAMTTRGFMEGYMFFPSARARERWWASLEEVAAEDEQEAEGREPGRVLQ